MGQGLDTDFPTTPFPFPCPQVYEGLKPSDKYEKPLDYRYGMRVRDLCSTHINYPSPHTASGTPHHYRCDHYSWLVSGLVKCPEP